jgi:hypothetical protein
MKALGNGVEEEGGYEIACYDGFGGGVGWIPGAFNDEGFGLF